VSDDADLFNVGTGHRTTIGLVIEHLANPAGAVNSRKPELVANMAKVQERPGSSASTILRRVLITGRPRGAARPVTGSGTLVRAMRPAHRTGLRPIVYERSMQYSHSAASLLQSHYRTMSTLSLLRLLTGTA